MVSHNIHCQVLDKCFHYYSRAQMTCTPILSICDCFCFFIVFNSCLFTELVFHSQWDLGHGIHLWYGSIANSNIIIIIDVQLTYAIVVIIMYVHVCIITRMAAA